MGYPLIKEIVNEEKSAGEHSAIWNGKNNYGEKVSSGTYFHEIETDKSKKTKKMLLIK